MSDKKYLLVYTRGNGYFCGCCRNQEEETEEFASLEEVDVFIEKMSKMEEEGQGRFDFCPEIIYEAKRIASFSNPQGGIPRFKKHKVQTEKAKEWIRRRKEA